MADAVTATHRLAFRDGQVTGWLSGGKMISGDCSRDPGNTGDINVLRPGMLMGKISTQVNSLGTVGHYAPSVLGVTTNAEAVGSTSIQAAAAVVTELVRRCGASGTFKLIGAGIAGGPIQVETVTYSAASSTNITVTAIANNFLAGSFICPTDGSEDPLTLIPDGYGVNVFDVDGSTAIVQPFHQMPIAGVIISANVLPAWPSEASLKAWIASRLDRAGGGGKFVFDHTY
jgi:hypothetical protein